MTVAPPKPTMPMPRTMSKSKCATRIDGAINKALARVKNMMGLKCNKSATALASGVATAAAIFATTF